MTHEEEIWKRFNDILEVSNHGRIRTIERVIQGVGFARSKTKRTIMTPLDYAARICYSSREVLQFSYDMGLKYRDSPGVFCECGVAAGAQVIAMAYAAPNKTIYAFDSFCGLPLASNKDNQAPGIAFFSKAEQAALPDPGKQVLESSGATVVSEGDFWHHIDTAFGPKKHNVKTVKGWFEETLPTFECPPISVLRLDGDLYNSTYVCLKYLYPKVIKGGVLILDDIQLPGCKAACDDYFQSIEFVPQYQYVDNVAYFIK